MLWGGAGSNTQHAYFQMLHQGGVLIPSDFIAFATSAAGPPRKAARQLFCPGRALAFGNDHDDPLRRCPGNQPSSTLLLPRLDPYRLGQLIAALRAQGLRPGRHLGINPFDQWGVELGKKLAARLLPGIEQPATEVMTDSSTAGLLRWYHRHKA